MAALPLRSCGKVSERRQSVASAVFCSFSSVVAFAVLIICYFCVCVCVCVCVSASGLASKTVLR